MDYADNFLLEESGPSEYNSLEDAQLACLPLLANLLARRIAAQAAITGETESDPQL